MSLGFKAYRNNLLVEGFVILFLEFNQIVVLGKVSTGDYELEQLSGEVLSVVVLLRHLDDEVLTGEVDLGFDAILGIAKLVYLNPGVLVSLHTLDLAILDSERNGQKERGADLVDTLWLASTEEDDVLTSEEGGLDVEVLDVSVLSAEPVPLPFGLVVATILFGVGHHELEAVLLEVYLDEYGDDLLVVVHNIDVLGNGVLLRESTSLAPGLLLDVVVVALICLVTTEHQNVR